MRTQRRLETVWCCVLVGLLASGNALAGGATLLGVRQGQMPNDTGGDTKLSLEEQAELGGISLKAVYSEGSSFGETRPKITDWTGFTSLRFDAFNPSKDIVSLELTIKHKGTKDYPTRVDVPLMLKPGKNAIDLPLANMANVDGSRPDLSFVKHWYIACNTAGTTVFFGDFSLTGQGAAAPAPAATPAAPAAAPAAAAPGGVIRITGKIGDIPVDLTITGLTISGPGVAGGAAPATAPAAPAAAPAPAAGPKATLLAISTGKMPNDTSGDTQLSLAENADLGGVCLKTTFAAGSSFGMSRAGLKDWTGYAALTFTAVNPAKVPAALTFVVKHAGSKSFDKRVDKAITLAPGKNAISVPLRGIANNDGSAPDLTSVRHWYIASDEPVTVLFGDFILEGGR